MGALKTGIALGMITLLVMYWLTGKKLCVIGFINRDLEWLQVLLLFKTDITFHFLTKYFKIKEQTFL